MKTDISMFSIITVLTVLLGLGPGALNAYSRSYGNGKTNKTEVRSSGRNKQSYTSNNRQSRTSIKISNANGSGKNRYSYQSKSNQGRQSVKITEKNGSGKVKNKTQGQKQKTGVVKKDKNRQHPNKVVIHQQGKDKRQIKVVNRKPVVTRRNERVVVKRSSHPKVVVHKRPAYEYRTVRVRNKHYYYREGIFYRHAHGGYVAIRAPRGAIVVSLPLGHVSFRFGTRFYWCYDGVYYVRVSNGYEVIDPPLGLYVTSIPVYSRKIYADFQYYWLANGVCYRRHGPGYVICEMPSYNQETVYDSDGKVIYIFMVQNSNGSHTPVELEKCGESQWKGPNGELYDGMPGNEQLRQVYGV